ncbi:ABC transporter ATP-binding protein [Paenibacillus campi]|uniref:ABC transporter ATP-binding protein n=1 Tax=Paenibacillus campi TaxID=3106031 RepID=UPI002AFDF2C2|nr:ABC transporter ATP-binding protein [Paenibacillus sp. SGZ-1014]
MLPKWKKRTSAPSQHAKQGNQPSKLINSSLSLSDRSASSFTATNASSPLLQLNDVAKCYGERTVLHNINWAVQSGECWGIIGPNGSGKTTLLQLLAGTERAERGTIMLQQRPLQQYSRRELARHTAVLGQDGLAPLHYPVKQVLAMGRYPYQNWLGHDELEAADILLETIMERLDLQELAERPLDQLSGGQRQRVAFGKVMAQQPKLLLLDEPTTYLDIAYQVHFMEWLDAWRKETGMTVIAVLHDLNLAARYCDRLLAVQEGRIMIQGTPEQLMEESVLKQLFRIRPAIVRHPEIAVPQLLLKRPSSTFTPYR